MKWLISLNGNRQVLYGMANSMTSPHFGVYEDSDDHQAESYFLYFSHIQGKDNLEEVVSAVKGLIQLLNGALAIDYGFNQYLQRGEISVDRIFNCDIEDPRESDWDIKEFLSNVPPSNPFIGKEEYSPMLSPYNDKTTAYIQLCPENEDIFNLLMQISLKFDWRNLYCIWDTICHYSGGAKKAISTLELDPDAINAFTGTANSFGTLDTELKAGLCLRILLTYHVQ